MLSVALSLGITNFFVTDSAKRPIAYVGDGIIPADEFYTELAKKKEILKQHYGRIMTDQEALGLGLVQRIVAELITKELLKNEAGRVGIIASDALLAEKIQNSSLFQGPQGDFQEHRFREFLNMNRLTERRYLDETRHQISRNLLVDTFSNSFSVVSSVFSEPLFNYMNAPRDLEIVTVNVDKMPSPAAPSESALLAFYNKHMEYFKVPETRSFHALVFDSEKVSQTVNLSEEDLKSAYSQQDNKQLEQRSVRFLALKTREIALKAKAELQGGASFEEVFMRYVHQPSEMAPPSETFTIKTLVPELSSEIFSMKKTLEVSDPVQFRDMYLIGYLTDIQPEKIISFEEQRFSILKRMTAELTREKIYDYTQRAEKMLASGTKLTEVADILNKDGLPGIIFKTVNQVTQEGKTVNNQSSSEISGLDSEVLPIVFDTPIYAYSDPKSLPSNDYVIVEVIEQKAPYQRSFAEAKELATKYWIFEQKRLKAVEKIKLLSEVVDKKGSLIEVARIHNLQVDVLSKVSRIENQSQSDFAGVIAQLNQLGLDQMALDVQSDSIRVGRAVKEYAVDAVAFKSKEHNFVREYVLPQLKQDILSSLIAGIEAYFPAVQNDDFFHNQFGKEGAENGIQLQSPDF
jgi:peptidyl-prolyl cis-trans isomerase D